MPVVRYESYEYEMDDESFYDDFGGKDEVHAAAWIDDFWTEFANDTEANGAPREPFDFTPMGVTSISFGPPHVLRAHMGAHRTCGA